MTSPSGDRVLRSSLPTCPVAPVRRMGPVVFFGVLIRCVLSALYGISPGDNAIVSGGFDDVSFQFADYSGSALVAMSPPSPEESGLLNRRESLCSFKYFLLFESVAEENNSAKDDCSDKVDGERCVRKFWRNLSCGKVPRILEGCDADAKKETRHRARGIAPQMKYKSS